MEIITVECPKCKGTIHVNKDTARCFCMYCRTEIQMKKPKSSESSPTMHHEFEAKLAIAKHAETLYMRDEKTFTQVLAAYDDVRLVGAHHADYWLSRARFFAKGTLREFNNDKVNLSEQGPVIDKYSLWMDTATEHYQGLVIEVEVEKNQTISKINTTFDAQRRKEERKREEDEEKRRIAEEEHERHQKLKLERHAANAPRRRMVAIIVIAIFLISLMWSSVSRAMQDRAAENRIIVEQEEKNQRREEERLAKEQRLIEEQEVKRQTTLGLIEERIATGYDTWDELSIWAYGQGIPWSIRVGEEELSQELIYLVNKYGIVGNYLSAEAGIGSQEDPDEVVLLLHFENVTYQETIAELLQLNQESETDLNNWLQNDGLERMEEAFNRVSILDLNEDGEAIVEDPKFGKEFISWTVSSSKRASFENSFLRIERVYRELRPTRVQIHEMALDILEKMDRNQYLETSGPRMRPDVAILLGLDSDWLDEDISVVSIRVKHLALNGEEIANTNLENAIEENFINWHFTYSYLNDNQSLQIIIYKNFNINVDAPGIRRSNFELIQDGMTLDEVNLLLAREGRISSSSGSLEIYTWQQAFTNTTVIISVTFENAVVTGKSQLGW